MKWTAEQSAAIAACDGNVLVSASAGSGKTAVMVERAAALVASKRAEVSELLIMTFASSAAEEMKSRLYLRLAEMMREQGADREYLANQLDKIDSGYICTLHSFCLDLLRMYFYETDLDAQFAVMEPQDVEVLKRAALESVLTEKLETADADFIELLEIFSSSRRDEVFKKTVLTLLEFASGEVDPEAFLKDTLFYAYRNCDALVDFTAKTIAARSKYLLFSCRAFMDRTEREGLKKCTLAAQQIESNLLRLAEADSAEKLRAVLPFVILKLGNADTKTEDRTEAECRLITEFSAFKSEMSKFFSAAAESVMTDAAEINCVSVYAEKHLKVLSEFCLEFSSAFAKKKRDQNAVDFSDFEHYAIKILENDDIAASVAARFRYVFVDEYQDTSRVQERILSRVSTGNNLFAVGDMKQSIYAFRRCDPINFYHKSKLYEETDSGEVIKLNSNFRSEGDVLSFCDGIMRRVMTEDFGASDYAADSMFSCGAKYQPTDDKKVEVHLVVSEGSQKRRAEETVYDIEAAPLVPVDETSRGEGELIAELIDRFCGKRIYDVKTNQWRNATLEDIVILTRSMDTYAKGVAAYLESKRGIPVSAESRETPAEVALLIDLLTVIANPQNDYPLLSVMRSKFFEFTDIELAQISILYRTQQKDGGKFFYSAVEYAAETDGALGDKVREFKTFMSGLRLMSTFASLAEVLDYAISCRGYDSFVLSQKYGEERLRGIETYLTMLEKSHYKFDLTGYLSDLAIGKESDIKSSGSSAGAVRMTTIHRSKGLEFPIVIYMGIGRPFYMPELSDRLVLDADFGGAIDVYDTEARVRTKSRIKKAIAEKLRIKNLQEELRLVYVAVTRAKNYLLISGRIRGDAGGAFDPYGAKCPYDFMKDYFSEYSELSSPYTYRQVEIKEEGGEQEAPHTVQDAPLVQPVDRALASKINASLNFTYPYEDYKLSQKYTVTGIAKQRAEDAAAPPAAILFQPEKTELGNLYHAILEQCDLVRPSMENLESCLTDIKKIKRIEQDTSVDLNVLMRVLTSDLMREIAGMKVYREREFMLYIQPEDIGLSGADRVLVQGKIDLLAVDSDGRALVVDFKSGNIYDKKSAVRMYGRQLELYALAVERVLKIPVKGRIVYSVGTNRHFYCD